VSVEDNKAVVEQLFESINRHDLDALSEVVAPDVIDHNAVVFSQPEGPGGVIEGVRMLLTGFPDLRITVNDLLVRRECWCRPDVKSSA
jgi:hypothetical protein